MVPEETQIDGSVMACSTNGQNVEIPPPNENLVSTGNLSTIGDVNPAGLDLEIPQDHATQASSSLPSRTAFAVGVEAYNNISFSLSPNTSVPNNSHIPLHFFTDPFDCELEKIRREEENGNINYEEKRSGVLAEYKRKMAEIQSDHDKQLNDIEDEYKDKEMEEEARNSFVSMSSLLGNAYSFKSSDKSGAKDVAAAKAALNIRRSRQQQQQQTASPRPSATVAEGLIPNPSSLLPSFPGFNTNRQRPISVQSTASPRPLSVTPGSTNTPIRPSLVPNFPRFNTTPLRPISHQADAVQSSAAEALPLHSPGTTNTPRPRPAPLIPNLTGSAYAATSFPPLRTPAPHLQRFRHSRPPPNSAPPATMTYPRRLGEEGNSNGGVVYLSDDD